MYELDQAIVLTDPKMQSLVKAFKIAKHGNKKGSLSMLKKRSNKRNRPAL